MSSAVSESIRSDKSSMSDEGSYSVSKLQQNFLLIYKNKVPCKKGIVFIGNSRIGKSTLSALLSGMQLQVKLYENESQAKLQPRSLVQRNNKNLIQHTMTSVTFFPNIYKSQIDSQNYTIVDLPGFKDTSYFKQLCNWRYIKNMLEELDQILFIMVIQVHNQEKQIGKKQLQMMERFRQAFPTERQIQPKQNLVIIVNFVQNIQTQQKYLCMRNQIKQKVRAQLKKIDKDRSEQLNKMQYYYERCFSDSRMLLIPRVFTNCEKYSDSNSLTDGVLFEQPRLLPFIKTNLQRMQKTVQSPYKINLTQQINQKSKRLKQVIWDFSKQAINNIYQKFQIYKDLLSHLLVILCQTEGARLDILDFKSVKNYYDKKNLQQYSPISCSCQIFGESLVYQSADQVVMQIVLIFNQMSLLKQKQNLKLMLQQIEQKFQRFLTLMLNLCKILFHSNSFSNIETINEDIWKSLKVQIKSILYLNQNVQNFTLGDKEQEQGQCYREDNFSQTILIYSNMRRVEKFKENLKLYVTKLVQKNKNYPLKRINIDLLSNLKQACSIMNFTGLKKQVLISFHTSCHKKICSLNFQKDHSKFSQTIQQIRQKWVNLTVGERQQISKWQSTSKQWDSIKCKAFIQIIRSLSAIGFDKQKIVNLYLKIDSFPDELMLILKQKVFQTQEREADKLPVFHLLLKVGQHFQNNCQFSRAQQCYYLAQNIYMYQDEEKVLNAKNKSIEIQRMIYKGQVDLKIQQHSEQLNKRPWKIPSDSQYQEIQAIIHQQLKDLNPNDFFLNIKKVDSMSYYSAKPTRDRTDMHKNISTRELYSKQSGQSSKDYQSPALNKLNQSESMQFEKGIGKLESSSEKVIQKQHSEIKKLENVHSQQKIPEQKKKSKPRRGFDIK